jgi:F0F1-type ATP synthase membrane subunit b/b'
MTGEKKVHSAAETSGSRNYFIVTITVSLIAVVTILLYTYATYPYLDPIYSAAVAVSFGAFITVLCHFDLNRRVLTVGDAVGRDIADALKVARTSNEGLARAANDTLEAIKTSNEGLVTGIDTAAKHVLEAIEATHKSIKKELPK